MRYRASAVVLVAMAIGLPLSHLEIQASDDSWLLLVDGRPVDVAGHLSQWHTQLTRNCRQLQGLPTSERLYADALQTIRQFSPPDSLSAQMVQLTGQGDWLLAQVRFSGLQESVVLLASSERGLTIPKGAVWSGTTHPHRPEPFIRRYLRSKAPAAPADLTACFELKP